MCARLIGGNTLVVMSCLLERMLLVCSTLFRHNTIGLMISSLPRVCSSLQYTMITPNKAGIVSNNTMEHQI